MFLGVVDDQNVYKWIKCKIWFSVNAKKVDDVSLDGRTKLFEVKYFLRYLYYIPIKQGYFKIFSLISRLPFLHHYRLISFGMVMMLVQRKKIESGLRRPTTLLCKSDTKRHMSINLIWIPIQLWWRNVKRQHVIGGNIPKISVSKKRQMEENARKITAIVLSGFIRWANW